MSRNSADREMKKSNKINVSLAERFATLTGRRGYLSVGKKAQLALRFSHRVGGSKMSAVKLARYTSTDSVKGERFLDLVGDVNSPVEFLNLRRTLHGPFAQKVDGARVGAYIKHGMGKLDVKKSQKAIAE